MSPTDPERRDRSTSFEVDRPDQPERDDLLEQEDVHLEEVEGSTMDREVGMLPDPEELPESQGETVLDAEREAEDFTPRRRLSDEEQERS
ncbi:MAG: hypothetical protein ACLFUG_07750 [Nitriliruptoraceae bacterium]